MKTRFVLLALAFLLVTNGVTAYLWFQRTPADDFAEITFKNISSNIIRTIWLQHGFFEVREHDIKPRGQAMMRFYMDWRNKDNTCHIVVSFDGGQGQTCEVSINNGEKDTIYIYEDRLESSKAFMFKRPNP